MVGVAQEVGGDAFDQAVFDGADIGAGGQASAVAEAEDMGIDGHGGLAESDVEHDVGGFAADAGEGFEGGTIVRDFAVVLVEQGLGEGGDVFRLGLPEADGADVLGDAGLAEGDHGGGGGGLGIKPRGGLVHRDVGGLGGEHDGDEEGVGVGEVQLGFGRRVGASEGLEEGADAVAGQRFCFARLSRGLGIGHGGSLAAGAGCGKRGRMEETLFEAAIVPYRSLSARGQRILLGVLTGLLMLGTLVFALVGAWPVGGFAGVELLAAILFFRWHARRMRAGELILLTPAALRIIRTAPDGTRRELVLPPTWLSAGMEERTGRAAALVVRGQGRAVEIAASLGEAERRDLAAALGEALHRLRNPVFDNEILR